MLLFLSFLYATFALSTANELYTLQDNYSGFDFFEGFTWFNNDDPTHGRVNYVDLQTAISKNLSFASADNSKFVLRVDPTQYVLPYQRGRDSVRITSRAGYEEAVIVLDVEHMPIGCGTWPAFWTLSAKGPWPNGGELDLIEGVNMNTRNVASLHTTPNCAMPDSGDPGRVMTGVPVSSNCDSSVNFNQGCGVEFTQPHSYGVSFNENKGGIYVLAKTSPIRVWFFPRNSPDTPQELLHQGNCTGKLDLSRFKVPDASFPTQDNCRYSDHFDAHNIVFDITLCGDWAGSAFTKAGCGSSCSDFVDNNPQAFRDAYWEINRLQIYTKDSNVDMLGFTAQGNVGRY